MNTTCTLMSLSCRRRLRSPTGYFFVFVLANSRFRAFALPDDCVLSAAAAMNTSRSAGSIGDVARLVRYLVSGSRREGEVGSSALSLESLSADRRPVVLSVSTPSCVAAAAACNRRRSNYRPHAWFPSNATRAANARKCVIHAINARKVRNECS